MESKIVDQRKLSTEYLEQHKVLKLFNILGSRLAKEKPDDPNEFLLQELTTILDLKNAKLPISLFSENDIENLFGIFDITNRGYVTKTQYLKALVAVGIPTPVLKVPTDEQITKKVFISHVYAEVMNDAY